MPIQPIIVDTDVLPAGQVSTQAAVNALVGHIEATQDLVVANTASITATSTRLEEQLRIIRLKLQRMGAW